MENAKNVIQFALNAKKQQPLAQYAQFTLENPIMLFLKIYV